MISEETLRELFAEAGETWPLPQHGERDLLHAARLRRKIARTPGTRWQRRTLEAALPRRVRAHPVLAMGAAAVVLVTMGVLGVTALGSLPTGSSAGPAVATSAGPARAVGGSGSVAPRSTSTLAGTAPSPAGSAGVPLTGSTGTGRNGGAVPLSTGARIVETGTVNLQVHPAAVDATLTRLAALVVAEGGFVASSQTQQSATSPSGTMTLRVPVANFTALVAAAGQAGRVTYQEVTGQDVTGQYVDLQARITALDTSRSTYLTIESKATTIGDILAVQQQIDAVQQELDQLQGQVQLLANESAFGTLSVTVGVPTPRPSQSSGLSLAWHHAVRSFVHGVEDIVAATGPLLLVTICLLLLTVLVRVGWRLSRRRML